MKTRFFVHKVEKRSECQIRSNIRELLLELPPDAVKQANAKIPRDDKTGELKFFKL